MPDPNSLWHKEISFQRKPKAQPAAELAHGAAPGEPAPAPAVPSPPPPVEPEPAPAAAHTVVEPPTRPGFQPGGQTPPVVVPPPVAPVVPAAEPAPAPPAPELEPAAAEPARQRPKRGRRPRRESREPGSHRHKSLVGLRVGAFGIAAAHVLNGREPRVVAAAVDTIEPGVVVAGEARRPDELAAALKAFFKKHGLPRGPVRLGIANNRIGVRVLELTGIEDPKQLGNAVRFRAQEVLPIPLEEAAIDYRVLREDVDEEGKRVHRVLLVVAHRQLVDGFASACRRAGLKLVGIDLETFGLLRALTPANARLGTATDTALVVASIGHDLSTLAVSDGRICDFTRVLEWGATELDSAIARALEVTPEAAEAIRVSAGFADRQELPAWLDPGDAERARAAMRSELQSFARDLVASLRFYQEQPDSLGISEIVLTGGGAELTGIAQELTRLVGLSVRIGDPLTRAKPGRKLAKESPASSLTAAIGLGIEV